MDNYRASEIISLSEEMLLKLVREVKIPRHLEWKSMASWRLIRFSEARGGIETPFQFDIVYDQKKFMIIVRKLPSGFMQVLKQSDNFIKDEEVGVASVKWLREKFGDKIFGPNNDIEVQLDGHNQTSSQQAGPICPVYR